MEEGGRGEWNCLIKAYWKSIGRNGKEEKDEHQLKILSSNTLSVIIEESQEHQQFCSNDF